MENNFRAFVSEVVDGETKWEVRKLSYDALPDGEVTIRVAYSDVNYKDGMATSPKGLLKTSNPIIPGIDLAGTVIESKDERFKEGDPVIVTSYELGISHHGGFSEVARVPAEWVVPLPDGLSLKEAMILGTAGFTAALSVQRLEESGLTPDKGSVLVTGATGGVGSVAVSILSQLGYAVVASTGKNDEHDYLYRLGAKQIIHRDDVINSDGKPLRHARWAGVVDPVGGKTLEYVLSTTQYGGSVALSGLTAGTAVSTTVLPFILRGINLLGIDSVYCPMESRRKVWKRLAGDFKPQELNESIVNDIRLEGLPDVLTDILGGKVRDRKSVV